ncbi:MAG: hypothetical protein IJT50_11340 [Lentisphaeria bacterium]|nr:hypothetical protein [Lentisphaeria bacterium]
MNKHICFLAVMAFPVFAAEHYVSPSESDNNPGTSDKPFATIGKAAAGALQQGEGMEHFVVLARKLVAARKIIAQP